jgi:hypothetical protein
MVWLPNIALNNVMISSVDKVHFPLVERSLVRILLLSKAKTSLCAETYNMSAPLPHSAHICVPSSCNCRLQIADLRLQIVLAALGRHRYSPNGRSGGLELHEAAGHHSSAHAPTAELLPRMVRDVSLWLPLY